jgi:hypothetical protein
MSQLFVLTVQRGDVFVRVFAIHFDDLAVDHISSQLDIVILEVVSL